MAAPSSKTVSDFGATHAVIDAPRAVETVNEVIDALGGTSAVAVLMSKKPQHVSNWRAEGRIASRLFLKFQEELEARNLIAPSELWGINEVSKKKRHA